MEHNSSKLFPDLILVLNKLDISQISDTRKKTLQELTGFIQQKVNSNSDVNLNFICTHNSRRSHLSQVWAQAISTYFNIPGLKCFSGGTEATALFPQAVLALENAGFQIDKISEAENSIYSIKFGPNELPVVGFSKTFDHSFNPESNFAAIMTCSHADSGCPFIPGAEKRISITYDDPKEFDNTTYQADKYKERSLQIATELFYVFSKIKM